MKIMVICSNCNKCYEIESDKVGRYVEAYEIQNKGLGTEFSWDIGNTDELSENDDVSSSDVEVRDLELRFTCQNCGFNDYIVIKNS